MKNKYTELIFGALKVLTQETIHICKHV